MLTKAKNDSSTRKAYLIDDKTPFAITESFRNLMTNIGFAIAKKEEGKGKIFCLTSSIAGEGKTTVAVNLALTCARTGAKTVIVDCDMRKPRVKAYLKTQQKGIVAYLSGQVKLENLIAKEVEPNLDVIVCRQVAPNPLTLLNNESFGQLLQELESRYEYVIIDTPPVDIVSDVTVIGQKTDGVLLITRQMYSNHKMLHEAIDKLNFANCRVLGVVLNDFTIARGKFYGNRYE